MANQSWHRGVGWMIAGLTFCFGAFACSVEKATETETSRLPIVGIDKYTNEVIYEEDRRMRHYVQIARIANSGSDPGFAQIGMVLNLTGLFEPSGAGPNIIEGLRQEVYVLFGSPNEIRASAAVIAGL